MSKLRRLPFEIGAAVLKHYVVKLGGEGVGEVIADTIADAGEKSLLKKVDDWLNQPKIQKKFNQAILEAEKCFVASDAPERIREGITGFYAGMEGWSFEDDSALFDAITNAYKPNGDKKLEKALASLLKRDFKNEPEEDLQLAAQEYFKCLRFGLITLKGQAPTEINRAIIYIQEELGQIGKDIHALKKAAFQLTQYKGGIQNFLQYYQGTQDNPTPFGGRDADLEALGDWFAKGDKPYAMLTAPAGRGKSAVLVHWLMELEGQIAGGELDDWAVVYFPVSIRFNTNLESTLFNSLWAQLAPLYGEQAVRSDDINEARNVVIDYLRRPPQTGQKLLVIIDGLDEMAGQTKWTDIFPYDPPEHVCVLLSARTIADTDWIDTLAWQTGWCHTFNLEPLDQAGVADVLDKMGNPLDNLAQDVDIVERLHYLSEGDPFIIELYVKQLLADKDNLHGFSVTDLESLDPGLAGFFTEWERQQRDLWKKNQEDYKEAAVNEFLNLAAFALGPLRQADLLKLSPDILGQSFPYALQDAVEVLRRFIIGNGQDQGYTFSHPRLGQFFRQRMPAEQQAAWREKFARYGEGILQALKNGTVAPAQVAKANGYMIQYYGTHLEEMPGQNQRLYNLICPEWLAVWQEFEYTNAGFLSDVRRVWQEAKHSGVQDLDIQILAGLCFSSNVSQDTNLGRHLLAAGLDKGVLSPTQVNVILQRLHDHQDFCGKVIFLLPNLNITKNEKDKLLYTALVRARQISSESDKARVLFELIEHLSEYQLENALAAAREFKDKSNQARVLGALAKRLSGVEKENVLVEALKAARESSDVYDRASVLVVLAKQLDKVERGKVLREALETAREIRSDHNRSNVLVVLAKYLDDIQVEEIFQAVQEIEYSGTRANVLKELAEYLSEGQVEEILGAAWENGDEWGRAKELMAIIEYLDDTQIGEILELAGGIESEFGRRSVLGDLIEHLNNVQVGEVLTIVQKMVDESNRAFVLRELAEHLNEAQAGEVFMIAQEMVDVDNRVRVLAALEEYLSEVQVEEVLTMSNEIGSVDKRLLIFLSFFGRLSELEQEKELGKIFRKVLESEDEVIRARVLIGMAGLLNETQVGEVLAVVREIGDKSIILSILEELVIWLNEAQQVEVALGVAREIGDETTRARVLGGLVEWSGEENREKVLKEGLNVTRESRNVYDQAIVLITLAKQISEVDREKVLKEALSTARKIGNKHNRANALGVLATQSSEIERENVLGEALGVAREIRDKTERARVLGTLIEHLSEAEREKVLAEVLDIMQEVRTGHIRANVLVELIRWLSEAHVGEVLAMERDVRIESARARVLMALAEYLSEAQVEEVLAMASQFKDEYDQARVLEALAKRLNEKQVKEVLVIARRLENEINQANVLRALAVCLNEPERGNVLVEALEVAWESENIYDKTFSLVAIAEHLSELEREKVIVEALDTAMKIGNEHNRANALGALTKFLNKAQVEEVLAMACQIEEEPVRARVLGYLSKISNQDGLNKLFELIKGLPSHAYDTLSEIIKRWDDIHQDNLESEYHWIQDILVLLSKTRRQDMLKVLQIYSPILHKLGGQKVTLGIVDAIKLTAQMWP